MPKAATPIVLTMGDPAGIGLDISLAAYAERHRLCLPPFAMLADPDALGARARLLGSSVRIAVIDEVEAVPAIFGCALPVLATARVPLVRPGVPSPDAAASVIEAIERAVVLTRAGRAAGLVTNPIAKSVLYAAGFKHPGHTEFLASLAASPGALPPRPVMMLSCAELRVVPLTIHIPLAAVPAAITADGILATCAILDHALRQDFAIASPRIAVAGLNPHAGESGTIGREDAEIIAPAIAALKARGLCVTGPHPADTLFHAEARARYDAVLAMYHDQALIPIKTLAFDRGVNATLGLSFVRTSPDHGTAFDIAGTGRARPDSLIEAIRLARRMAQNRDRHGLGAAPFSAVRA
jgi:4-hydroxythreonine-4-phosphate dehydrogenase